MTLRMMPLKDTKIYFKEAHMYSSYSSVYLNIYSWPKLVFLLGHYMVQGIIMVGHLEFQAPMIQSQPDNNTPDYKSN